MQRQSSMIQEVARTAEIYEVPLIDSIVDVFVMKQSNDRFPRSQEFKARLRNRNTGVEPQRSQSSTQVQRVNKVVDSPVFVYLTRSRQQYKNKQCSSDTLQRERDATPFLAAGTGPLDFKWRDV